MLEKFIINKKICYILGGCGLIGEHVVELFSRFNVKIVILDIDKKKAKEISSKNNNIFFEYFNCNSKKDLTIKINNIFNEHGCPHIFINCSHPTPKKLKNKSFANLDKDLLDDYVKIHMNSSAWIARVIAEKMFRSKIKGSLILFSSIYGMLGQDMNIYNNTKMSESVPYSLIKGGIINYVRQMASYYGKYNIRVNCISPGGLQGHVKGSKNKQDKLFIKNYNKKVPIGRLAKPEEIAYSTLFLASNASSYITGHNLVIDGGWSII